MSKPKFFDEELDALLNEAGILPEEEKLTAPLIKPSFPIIRDSIAINAEDAKTIILTKQSTKWLFILLIIGFFVGMALGYLFEKRHNEELKNQFKTFMDEYQTVPHSQIIEPLSDFTIPIA